MVEAALIQKIKDSGREVIEYNQIKFIKQLGVGGFGVVYEVEINGVPMACKVIS